MDRKNPGGDRTDLYHLFVKTSRQEKKRGRAGLILRSFWDKNEIFHRVYIIDVYLYLKNFYFIFTLKHSFF